MANQRIIRHEAIKDFSRDHHQGLMFCWKIKRGFENGVNIDRMKQYADWFWENHLVPHFDAEEGYLFPILPEDDELVVQAIAEHRRLKALFSESDDVAGALRLIEKELDDHIRLEERILFEKIQVAATDAELEIAAKHHKEIITEDWQDEFWKRQ